jgi:hypothetical protein
MSYPVFASGDVLNASDMNGVGLWLVKTQTVGSGVTTVTVTDAFNTNYDAYRIIYTGGTMSAATDMMFYFGATPPANGYSESQTFVRYDTGGTGVSTVNNQPQWTFVGGGDTNGCFIQMDVYNPFNSGVRKYMTFSGLSATVFTVVGTGIFNNTSSFTSFTLDPSGAATMTGGTICVYGFKK